MAGPATRPVARCAEIDHLGGVTQEWVAPGDDDPALDALADGLAPARELGLDVTAAEAILRRAKGRLNGTREQAAGEARIALTSLAAAAGLDPRGMRELIPDPARRRGVDGAISEIALLLDMDTFEEQALRLVWKRAVAIGLGPLRWIAPIRSIAGLRPGHPHLATLPADPESHLRAWNARGVLVGAADRVRRAIDEALPAMPDGIRPLYAEAGRGDLDDRLGRGVEAVVQEAAPQARRPPSNPAWRFVGILQWLNFVMFAAAIASMIGSSGSLPAWQVSLRLASGVPAWPFMLALCLLVGFGLTLWLRLNASKFGHAWASLIENGVRREIRIVVEREAFASVAPIESARGRLGEAWHRILH
jgi:hypothetical protein